MHALSHNQISKRNRITVVFLSELKQKHRTIQGIRAVSQKRNSRWAQNLLVKMKILNPGSRDISQKLSQSKCFIFRFLNDKIDQNTNFA